MPIYQYRCPTCLSEEEVISSISDFDKAPFHCGEVMQRIWSIPRIVVKQTSSGMALDTLNGMDTSYMKPMHKQWAAEGLKKPDKVFY